MSGFPPPAAPAARRARSVHALCRWACTLPAAATVVAAVAALVVLPHAGPSAAVTGVVGLAILAVAFGAGLVAAAALAVRVGEREQRLRTDAFHDGQAAGGRQVHDLHTLIVRGLDQLSGFAEAVKQGVMPAPAGVDFGAVDPADPVGQAIHDLLRFQAAAQHYLFEVASREAPPAARRVDVVNTLALRMQSLVHRELSLLEEILARVEDPDLTEGLFRLDHLAALLRRQAENLAVIGGDTSRRLWTYPVPIVNVVRAAVQEIEQYSRVKMVPPLDGAVRGDAVADVIHLLAELVENATLFSPPYPVWVRVEQIPAGWAIEIEDRGWGLDDAERQWMNQILADPHRVSLDDLLRDGRIGLWVVAVLAGRHGINVELKKSLYHGVLAVVVLPEHLVEPAPQQSPSETTADENPPIQTGETAAATAPAPAICPAPATAHQASDGLSAGSSVVFAPASAAAPPVPAQRHTLDGGSVPLGMGSEEDGEEELPALPRRVKQAHLAPELRDAPDDAGRTAGSDHAFTAGLVGFGNEPPATRACPPDTASGGDGPP